MNINDLPDLSGADSNSDSEERSHVTSYLTSIVLDPEDSSKIGIDFPIGYGGSLYAGKEVPIVETEIAFYLNGEEITVNYAKMYKE
jgi:hypothetical protein